MKKHSEKAHRTGEDRSTRDKADHRQASGETRKETEAAPDTETEIGKAEQLGDRFKKPA